MGEGGRVLVVEVAVEKDAAAAAASRGCDASRRLAFATVTHVWPVCFS